MRLPRTETTLAAVLLLAAAPFALATPPGSAPPPSTPASTPGVTPPETSPSTTNPSAIRPSAAKPDAMPPGAGSSPRGQDLQSGGAMSSNGWSQGEAPSRAARRAPQADIDAAKSARVSLTQAINAAQGHSHGEVVAARFELRQGKPEYLVRAFDGRSRQEWLGHIDANTGQLIGRGRTMPLSRLPQADQQELTAVAESGTSLAQAVRTVEQQRGGKALSASLSARNGQVGCRTELLKSDGSTQLAMTGPQPGRARSYR